MINQARSFTSKLQNDFYLSCVKPFHWHIFEQNSKIANLLLKKKRHRPIHRSASFILNGSLLIGTFRLLLPKFKKTNTENEVIPREPACHVIQSFVTIKTIGQKRKTSLTSYLYKNRIVCIDIRKGIPIKQSDKNRNHRW